MRKLGRVAAAVVVVFVAAGVALIAYAVLELRHDSDVLVGFLAKRADAGDPEAQVALGLTYRVGFWFIVPKDEAKAVELFRQAAEEGSAAGKFRLGESLEGGRGVSKDLSQAIEWYRQAAEQLAPPDATSTEWLATANARSALRRLYIRGQIFPQVDARTGDWWRKFSEQADSEAKAFARLRLGAEGGDADSQTRLGLSYLTGFATLKDRGKAAEWFTKAAEQGDLRAKCLYAVLKASDANWGSVSNGPQAVETCRAAAGAGDADAQRILGVLYERDRGVQKDLVESAAWTRKAAEEGRADAQWSLSYKYEKGEGVPKDKALACAWKEKAVEQNYPDALEAAAIDADIAKISGTDRCPGTGTMDYRALTNSFIEYSSEGFRELFPNLLDGAAR